MKKVFFTQDLSLCRPEEAQCKRLMHACMGNFATQNRLKSMKVNDLAQAISELDDKFYEEAINYKPVNRSLKAVGLVAVAAVFTLVVGLFGYNTYNSLHFGKKGGPYPYDDQDRLEYVGSELKDVISSDGSLNIVFNEIGIDYIDIYRNFSKHPPTSQDSEDFNYYVQREQLSNIMRSALSENAVRANFSTLVGITDIDPDSEYGRIKSQDEKAYELALELCDISRERKVQGYYDGENGIRCFDLALKSGSHLTVASSKSFDGFLEALDDMLPLLRGENGEKISKIGDRDVVVNYFYHTRSGKDDSTASNEYSYSFYVYFKDGDTEWLCQLSQEWVSSDEPKNWDEAAKELAVILPCVVDMIIN